MCDPASILMAAGTGLQIGSQISAGRTAEANARLEAADMDYQAGMERDNAALREIIAAYQNGLATGLVAISETEYAELTSLRSDNAALNHALNVAQTELRLNGATKAADEVARLHSAALGKEGNK